MKTIKINELTIKATIGTHAWEQQIQQTLHFDIEFCYDTAKAASSDQLADAIDYQALAQGLTEFVQAQPWQLLERLHHECCEFLQQHFAIEQLKLCINKPFALNQAKGVSIST